MTRTRRQLPEWHYLSGNLLGPEWSAWVVGVRLDTSGPDPVLRGLSLDPLHDDRGRTMTGQSVSEVALTKNDLRRLPFVRLLAVAAEVVAGDFHAWAARIEPTARPRGGSRAHLEQVAEVYRTARGAAVIGGPRAAVSRHFGVSLPTADRYIRQARVAGVLEEYQQQHGRERT